MFLFCLFVFFYGCPLASYPVIADKGGEVGCAEVVQDVEKLGAVDGVYRREAAARKQAQLEQ